MDFACYPGSAGPTDGEAVSRKVKIGGTSERNGGDPGDSSRGRFCPVWGSGVRSMVCRQNQRKLKVSATTQDHTTSKNLAKELDFFSNTFGRPFPIVFDGFALSVGVLSVKYESSLICVIVGFVTASGCSKSCEDEEDSSEDDEEDDEDDEEEEEEDEDEEEDDEDEEDEDDEDEEEDDEDSDECLDENSDDELDGESSDDDEEEEGEDDEGPGGGEKTGDRGSRTVSTVKFAEYVGDGDEWTGDPGAGDDRGTGGFEIGK
ncbi:hypothetical protein BJ166DRAFT_501082 [Pestalotiopsis sp. NC0098]|nr:hypothetical protein BJ166DRAFT_501082 [Pestalotiopsis sp. NC0098]